MPALLAEAECSGGMTTGLRRRIAQMIETLLPQFDAVLITCSTLGPVAGDFSAQDRVMRTDGMLAEALQRQAGRTVALCAAESTLAATRTLFCQRGAARQRLRWWRARGRRLKRGTQHDTLH